jgi:hypothetical protein
MSGKERKRKVKVFGTLRPQPLTEDQHVEDDEESLAEESSTQPMRVPVSY